MKKFNIAILGAGYGGLITALVLNRPQYNVTLFHDPSTPIFPVGESTDPNFARMLRYSIDFRPDDIPAINGTIKLGVLKTGFGIRNHPYTTPFYPHSDTAAIHLSSDAFQPYVLKKLNITPRDVSLYKKSDFDYTVISTGFPQGSVPRDPDYNYLDSCIYYKVDKCSHSLYTGAHATKDGWMWQIPLQNGDSFGYLFNKDITPIAQAISNFKELRPGVTEENTKIVPFFSFVRDKIFDGTTLYMGSSALFTEPLEATTLGVYIRIAESFHNLLCGSISESEANTYIHMLYERNKNFIIMHYLKDNFGTPFWREITQRATTHFSQKFEQYQDLGKMVGLYKIKQEYDTCISDCFTQSYGTLGYDVLLNTVYGLGLQDRWS